MVVFNRSRPVRLVASVDSPLVNECFDRYPSACTEPGFEAEYAYTIVHDLLKLPVEWIRVENYTEMIEYLDNGLADMCASSMFVDASFGDKYGYAPPYIWDGTALFVKETIIDTSESLLLVRQFAYDLWAAMALGTVITVIVHYLAKTLRKRHPSANGTFLRKAEHVVRFVLYCFRSHVLYALWFLFVSIMLNFYGNLMAVDLLHSSKIRTIPFKSMDELGDKLLTKECHLAIYDVYIDSEEFQGTVINPNRHNRSWAKKFRDAYLINPPIYTKTREELAELILNSTCVVGLDWLTIKAYFMSRWCNLRLVIYDDEPEMFYQYTFYTTMSNLREAVNTIINSDAFQAFPDILTNKYYFQGFMPDCENIETVKVSALTLAKLQDGFYVLLFGLSVAMVIVLYLNYKGRRVIITNKLRQLYAFCQKNRIYDIMPLKK